MEKSKQDEFFERQLEAFTGAMREIATAFSQLTATLSKRLELESVEAADREKNRVNMDALLTEGVGYVRGMKEDAERQRKDRSDFFTGSDGAGMGLDG